VNSKASEIISKFEQLNYFILNRRSNIGIDLLTFRSLNFRIICVL